jgi:hypothetical protein
MPDEEGFADERGNLTESEKEHAERGVRLRDQVLKAAAASPDFTAPDAICAFMMALVAAIVRSSLTADDAEAMMKEAALVMCHDIRECWQADHDKPLWPPDLFRSKGTLDS